MGGGVIHYRGILWLDRLRTRGGACTGASILQREGFSDVALVLGSTNAWREAGYPMVKAEADGPH